MRTPSLAPSLARLAARAAIVGFAALQPLSARSTEPSSPRLMSAHIAIRQQFLAGNELRLVVETSRSWVPRGERNRRTADAKGYLVRVDLGSSQPIANSATVVGPLWDVPNDRSDISFSSGETFDKKDTAARAATPDCRFDVDGTLLRFIPAAERGLLARDELALSPAGGTWKRQGDTRLIPSKLMPGSEDRIRTETGRYGVLREDGKTACFDLFTGEPIDDPWLSKRFAEARSIETLNNVRLFLTDDLNHLVVSPIESWNQAGRLHKWFKLDGVTYVRSEAGLAYSRPAEKPVVFERRLEDDEFWLAQGPHGAISIAGQLFLLERNETMMRLYTPDLGKEIVTHEPPEEGWEYNRFMHFQHIAEAKELVLFATNEITATARPDETMRVLRWRYETNTLTHADARIVDLFALTNGQLKPKSIVPIVQE